MANNEMACVFCGSLEELQTCGCVGLTKVLKSVAEAELGDIWFTVKNNKRGRIAEIQRYEDGCSEGKVFRFWVLIPGHPKPYPYAVSHEGTFWGEDLGPCGAVACWRHMRELSPEHHVCENHWRAWESAT